MTKAKSNGLTLKQWQTIFETLTADLESLEQIAEDPENEKSIRDEATAQMDDARIAIYKLHESRGYIEQ